MRKINMVRTLVLFSILGFFCPIVSFAADCPDLKSALRFEIHKTYPQFEIAFLETFSKQEQQKLAQRTRGRCPHLVELSSFLSAILLKAKQGNSYRAILVESLPGQPGTKWTLQVLGDFADDLPVLAKARGGYYADVASGNRLAITRDSIGLKVILIESGKVYIYKMKEGGGVDHCQIK